MAPRIVLITGAAGNLGVKLRRHLEARGGYELRLLDIDPRGDDQIVPADLATYDETWTRLFKGVDVVVHLAANGSSSAEWPNLIGPNVDGLLNVHMAAAENGTPRVIVASSVWALAAHHQGEGPISAGDPDPGPNAYGATKLFAERTARAFAQALGMTTVAVRIGACRIGENAPFASLDAWEDGCWLSNADLCRGLERAILAPLTGFTIVNLTSRNEGSRWSLAEAEALLGYSPTDRWSPAEAHHRPTPRFHPTMTWAQRLIKRCVSLRAGRRTG